MPRRSFDYDVALSFAGSDRPHAESLASSLKAKNIKVFYDAYEKANLWGKDLYQHLQTVYRDKTKYCVVFFSKNYVKRLWTKHELRQMQARAFHENREYILPLRLDDTSIPGVTDTTGYIDLRHTTIAEVADLVESKVNCP